MRPPEELVTERLRLRPLVESDAPAIFEGYASLEDATRWMIFPRHRSIDESLAFARRCEQVWRDGAAFPYAITLEGAFIGCIELRVTPPKANFGYILARTHWSQGFATEAARAIVEWARARPEIYRVWATCHPENRASARVLEKAGLSYETRLARWEARPNLAEPAGDSLVYALTR
jgi:RimJ/RimL family protein N-acetyltransferase